MTGPASAPPLVSAGDGPIGAPAREPDPSHRWPRSPSELGRWIVDHRWAVALGVIALLAGIALRWWILGSALGQADLDEATVGVQARQFADGHPAVFFMNQAYGGTLETALVAISLKVFGTNVFALKLVPMVLALVAAVITRAVAVELRLNRTAQWAVPVLVWCGPAYAVLFSTKERGFYGVALVLAAAYLLLVLRLSDRPTARDALILGACVGLGWWQSPLTMLVAVPAVLWLLCFRPRVFGVLLWAIPTAIVAALPWIIWNVGNEWGSTHTASSFGTTWWDRFFDWLLRMQVVLGLETPFDPDRQVVALRWAGLAVLVVIVVIASLRTRRRAPWFLPAMVLGYGLLYAVNTLAAGVGDDPRYTYLMVPIVAIAIGAVLPDAARDWQRFAIVMGVGALAVASTVWGLSGTIDKAEEPHPNQFLASPGMDEVVDLLEERGVNAVISDIGGMQVAFLSQGRVVGASIAVPRSDEYEEAGRAADPSTYVLDDELMRNADRLRLYLTENHIGFEEQEIGKWRVFFVDQQVGPGDPPLITFFLQVDKPLPGEEPGG